MAIPVITLVNQTASPITLNQLGVIVPGSGNISITGTDASNQVSDVLDDDELHVEVDAGNITVTIGAVALNTAQSGVFLNPASPVIQILHNLTATTDPVAGDDENDGYSRGSLWLNTSTTTLWVCYSPTVATALWSKVSVNGVDVSAHASRHLPGGSDPLTTAAPVNVTKAANAAGVAAAFARSDHKHDVSTAAPGAVGVATASGEGAATTLARSDHTHQSNTAPVNVTKAAAVVGTSGEPARADHKHDVTTAAAVAATVGQANAEGAATTLARSNHTHAHTAAAPVAISDSTNGIGAATTFVRSDHVHAHGDRGGGTLHAAATPSVAGFISAADKTKLDGIATGATNTPLTNTGPVDVTKAAAVVGVAADAARADHKHDVTTAAAVAVGTANAEGTATTLARSDHTHQVTGFAIAGQVQGDVLYFNGTSWVRLPPGTSGQFLQTTGAAANPVWASAAAITATPPVDVTKAAAAVGVATTAARADHKHDVTTAAPTATGVATASGEGTATTLARSDHTHQSNTAPVNVTKAAAVIGTSGEPARADHKHDVSTAAAVAVGTSNAEGTATTLARSDHTHQVTGFAIAGQVQGDVLYFNGTAWVRLAAGIAGQRLTTQGTGANPSWAGPKNYPNSATNPVSPAPAAGDTYFNTVLNMQMQYDASRSKWLSMDSATLQFGRNGSVGLAGTYLRAINGMITSPTQGYDALFNGTVVGWSIRRTTVSGASYAVVASGTDIATLVYVSGSAVRETTTNADFAQGSVLAARLVSDAVPSEDNPQVFIRMKWRL